MLKPSKLNLIKETSIVLAAPAILYPISYIMQNVDNAFINTGVVITLGAIGYCSANKFGDIIDDISKNTNHTAIGLLVKNFRNKKNNNVDQPLKENINKIK